MGMGDLDRLEKRLDYTAVSKVSRENAWLDFKHDWYRFYWACILPLHILTGQWVNLVRICGVQDRNKSQKIGRFLMGGMVIVLLGILAALLDSCGCSPG